MKKTDKQISIIIPCYNVQEYIENCLNSLTKQLRNYNYEIILINDCSKDKTKKIINEYMNNNKDINIRFIDNKENIGAGASRNKAIKEAKYDLISFIDSDDYVDDNFFDEMIETISNEKSDVVVCDIKMIYDDHSLDTLYACCNYTPSKYNIINNGLAASPCNKIFKKELLIKYPFAEGIMNEDIACVLSIIANCNTISYTSNTKYNYIQHSDSVQNSSLSDKKLDIFKAIELFENNIQGNKEYSDFMNAVIFNQLICFMMYVPVKEKNFKTRAKFLNKFAKYAKPYQLRKNRMYNTFINSKNKKTGFYYRLVNKLICEGHGYLASSIMFLFSCYKKVRSIKTVIKKDITIDDLVLSAKKQSKMKTKKTISVVIPNYNYARFLYQRIYSILNQNYKINEIILLDDCSTDNSIEILDEIEKAISPYIKVLKKYNKKNSGCVFDQWEEGFKEASGEYVWIAEADDYCEKNIIKTQIKNIKKGKNVVLSYCDTAFVDKDGHIILKTIKPEIDILKTKHWDKDFVDEGLDYLLNYSYVNCTIANVSSVLFKNGDYSKVFKQAKEFKQVGDWRFYVGLSELGQVAFVNKPLNYYRVHGNNVTSTTKKQKHFDEIKKIHDYLNKNYKLTKEQKKNIKDRYDFLKRVWDVK